MSATNTSADAISAANRVYPERHGGKEEQRRRHHHHSDADEPHRHRRRDGNSAHRQHRGRGGREDHESGAPSMVPPTTPTLIDARTAAPAAVARANGVGVPRER